MDTNTLQPDPTLYPDGTYDVVDMQSLQQRTSEGCRLARILPGPSTPLFLLLKHRDTTHAELRARVQELDSLSLQFRQQADRSQRERDELAERLEEVEEKLNASKSAAKGHIERLESENDALKKNVAAYEALIAGVRKHMGEKAFKEACDS